MPITVTVHDVGDLKRLIRDLRQAADGKQLRKELTGGMRQVLRRLVPLVQAAYRAGPSSGGRRRGRGLRELLARSVRVEVRTGGKFAGARIRADGRRMPDHYKALPAYWEGDKPRWRAPLFGDRTRWYAHEPHPTFYRTVQPHTVEALREVDQVIEQVRRKLERG